MFSKSITNSDPFLELPQSTQNLYFHLGMNADDDGFVQIRSVMKQIGSSDDDAKLLFTKSFLIRFEDGVIVITDWRINNEIRQDRYKQTFYIKHLKRLKQNENKAYLLDEKECQPLVVPNDNQMTTQVRLGKVSIGKSKERESEEDTSPTPKEKTEFFFKGITDFLQKLDTDESVAMGNMLAKMSIEQGIESLPKKKLFWDEIVAFGAYWQEKDHLGKRERWQMQKTFEIEKRLKTWLKKAGQWSGNITSNNKERGFI